MSDFAPAPPPPLSWLPTREEVQRAAFIAEVRAVPLCPCHDADCPQKETREVIARYLEGTGK